MAKYESITPFFMICLNRKISILKLLAPKNHKFGWMAKKKFEVILDGLQEFFMKSAAKIVLFGQIIPK